MLSEDIPGKRLPFIVLRGIQMYSASGPIALVIATGQAFYDLHATLLLTILVWYSLFRGSFSKLTFCGCYGGISTCCGCGCFLSWIRLWVKSSGEVSGSRRAWCASTVHRYVIWTVICRSYWWAIIQQPVLLKLYFFLLRQVYIDILIATVIHGTLAPDSWGCVSRNKALSRIHIWWTEVFLDMHCDLRYFSTGYVDADRGILCEISTLVCFLLIIQL